MASKSPFPLKKKRDFEHLRLNGRVIHVSQWLMLVSAPNGEGLSRAGWTLPKFVGIAVVRNRLKRWGREQIKNWNTLEWSENLDLNFVFKKRPAGFYRDLDRKEFGIVFEKAFEKLSKKPAHLRKP